MRWLERCTKLAFTSTARLIAVDHRHFRIVMFYRIVLGDFREACKHRDASLFVADKREHLDRTVDDPIDVVVNEGGHALEIPLRISVVEFPHRFACLTHPHISPAIAKYGVTVCSGQGFLQLFQTHSRVGMALWGKKRPLLGPRNGPISAWDLGAAAVEKSERLSPGERFGNAMDRDNGLFGLVIGGIVAVAAILFIMSGGELGGKKTVEGDRDLPPVASTQR